MLDVVAISGASYSAAVGAVTPRTILTAGIIAAGAAAHLELTRAVERSREAAAWDAGAGYVDYRGMWTAAAVLLLPAALLAPLVAIGYLHAALRVYRHPVPHRVICSAASQTLACLAARAVLHAAGPIGDSGPAGVLVIVAALLTWWAVNLATVTAAMALATGVRSRKAAGDLTDQVAALASLGLGATGASVAAYSPWTAAVLVGAVWAVQWCMLIRQPLRAYHQGLMAGMDLGRQMAERDHRSSG